MLQSITGTLAMKKHFGRTSRSWGRYTKIIFVSARITSIGLRVSPGGMGQVRSMGQSMSSQLKTTGLGLKYKQPTS